MYAIKQQKKGGQNVMFKCNNCGATLRIEDEICQYCDTINPYFQKHREDMQAYEEKFQETQNEVLSHSKSVTKKLVLVSVICVLLSLNIIVLFGISQAREFSWWLDKKDVSANSVDHKKKLTEFQETNNIVGFISYLDHHGLAFNEEFGEYYAVKRSAENYMWIFEGLMELNYREDLHPDSYDFWLEIVADSVLDTYKIMVPDEYSDMSEYTPLHVETMEHIAAQSLALLKGYTTIPHSEIDAVETISKAKLMLLLEEGLPK